MKYKKIPSINETIKKASMREARNMSALPAMRFISNVTPSRRNVSNGRRKVQRPEDKKSVGEIDWNSFAPSAVKVRGIDMLSKKESYSTPSEPSTLLLDLYPNASAAYSLRKLRTAYAGDAIRVRRSSDDTETDIGFVDNELDTVALLAFVGANDGFVSTWYDQSGNNNHAEQGAGTNQPQIVSSGSVNLDNGKPCVQFDGSNHSIVTSSNFIANTDLSLFVLRKFNDRTQKPQDIVSQGATANSYGFKYGMSGAGQDQLAIYDDSLYLPTDGITIVNQELHSLINTSSTTTLNINAVGQTLSDSRGRQIKNNNDPLTIGNRDTGGGFFNGNIQELVIYTADKSTDRSGIESNINSHYKIYWDGSQSGLLDSYPNASAAYSLRALNSNYTGPAITVRRSSDDNEQDIKLLYNGELDTEGLLSFVGAGDGFVSKWYDQSGNGNHSEQGAGTSQPQIVSSGTLETINGLPTIKFLTNKWLNSGDACNASTGNMCAYVAASVSEIGKGNFYAKSLLAGVPNRYGFFDNNAVAKNKSNLGDTITLSGIVLNELSLINQEITFTTQQNHSLYLNSVQVDTTKTTALQIEESNYDFLIGAYNDSFGGDNPPSNFHNGTISELIAYTTNESSNRTGIESNINSHYNIY